VKKDAKLGKVHTLMQRLRTVKAAGGDEERMSTNEVFKHVEEYM